jgi:uncharacterized membrane protein YphA (DoxX/SURF4 family)
MLNIFPIQFLAPIAYTLLRLCVGLFLIRLGINHITNRDSLSSTFSFSFFPFPQFVIICMSIAELLAGLSLTLGYLTQLGALLSVALSLKCIFLHARLTHPLIPSRSFYTLLLFASISIFITGAGAFAFDLPI